MTRISFIWRSDDVFTVVEIRNGRLVKIDTMDEAAALSRMSELQAQGFTPVSVKGNNSHVYAQAG